MQRTSPNLFPQLPWIVGVNLDATRLRQIGA
jgi:hypothetical protein